MIKLSEIYEKKKKSRLGKFIIWAFLFVLKWTQLVFAISFVKNQPFEGATVIGWLSIILSILKSPVDLVEIYWIFARLMNNLHLRTDFYYLSLLETIKIRIFLVIGGIILWVQNENSYPTGPILVLLGLSSLIISSISSAMHN